MLVTLPVWGSSYKRRHILVSSLTSSTQPHRRPPFFSYFTLFLFFCSFFFFLNEVYLIYNTVFVSDGQQSNSVFFQIISQCRLLQDTEYSSLFCTVNPCCLSILCVVVCIPLPFGDPKFVFYVCKSVSFLYVDSLVWFFRFHIDMVSYNICFSSV